MLFGVIFFTVFFLNYKFSSLFFQFLILVVLVAAPLALAEPEASPGGWGSRASYASSYKRHGYKAGPRARPYKAPLPPPPPPLLL